MPNPPGKTESPVVRAFCEPASPQIVEVPAAGRQTVWWVMTVLLAVIATVLVMRWDEAALSRLAWAQAGETGAGPAPGARGIYAFTGQIGNRSYGLFMLDVDTGTVWCYEMAAGRHMKLLAARSWIFDRYLEEFNVAAPTPTEVRQLVEQQQAARKAQGSQPSHNAVGAGNTGGGGGLEAPPGP